MALESAADKRLIQDYYDELIASCKHKLTKENLDLIKKAFDFANSAHSGLKRRSGEPYIIHPLAVATIVTTEIGLGTKSIVASILHDVVEDTDYTLEDISDLFGDKISIIVDGLTKLAGNFDLKQAENFRKMVMTLSDDVRVILIKLSDRLHNMRTLEAMPANKQLKIAGETLYIYAPLAHRLGLYAFKTQLEDLSLKYKHPDEYQNITLKLQGSEKQRMKIVKEFIKPINKQLDSEKFTYTITGRPKSVHSIWKKMQVKKVAFDEIYDLLAIRIIFDPIQEVEERRQCWDIFSIITGIYRYKPDRIRDWISMPKANGYEALHLTVMGPHGKWVEVQIRSSRMDEIAERGFAAHWKYKGINGQENELDKWLKKIRDQLQSPESDVLEFLDEFKMNLFSSEIVVFTPKGEMKSMPKGSTVLDFAYEIHTHLGNKCIGAKINHQLVPLSHVLKSGDQIEILTSERQSPQATWLDFVHTAKAKTKVKNAFKLEHKKHIEKGKKIVEKGFKDISTPITSETLRKLINHLELSSKEQLYARTGMGIIKLDNIDQLFKDKKPQKKPIKYWRLSLTKKKRTPEEEGKTKAVNKKKTFYLEEDNLEKSYILSTCCNPIPGDDVIGHIQDNGIVSIHKKNCPKTIKLMSNHGEQIVVARWKQFKIQSYLTHLYIRGFDRQGLVSQISTMISNEHDINMRSVSFDSNNGIFIGHLYLYVHNISDLNNLIYNIQKVKGVESVERIEEY